MPWKRMLAYITGSPRDALPNHGTQKASTVHCRGGRQPHPLVNIHHPFRPPAAHGVVPSWSDA